MSKVLKEAKKIKELRMSRRSNKPKRLKRSEKPKEGGEYAFMFSTLLRILGKSAYP